MNVDTYLDTTAKMVASNVIPDMTQRQVAVLLAVASGAEKFRDSHGVGFTVRGLASALNVSKPAITRAADRLSEEGLVRRRQVPEDRRLVTIEPTAKGTRLISQIFG